MAGVFPLRSCDNWYVSSGSNPCLYVGGNYIHARDYGLFCSYGYSVSLSNASVGARLMYLP